jgi:hypothetical protein
VKMSQLGVVLQESVIRERETRTILRFLREEMDGLDGARRRRSLKERLGLKGMGCCGANWGFRATTLRGDDEDEESQREQVVYLGQAPPEINSGPDCTESVPAGSGMNLAAALAAERHFRASYEPDRASDEPEGMAAEPMGNNRMGTGTAPGIPLRVSLMRLLEETTDGGDRGEAIEKEKGPGELGSDSVCCVCMLRKKGAAFIPCGHTFCRVCSRELWLNRGSCPLCNRSILEILDIF